ncbi:MAG: hypothetical protein PHT07_20790 [Paludibacter sp.]|nr:hypothetical protein [Paludibacter sp.]
MTTEIQELSEKLAKLYKAQPRNKILDELGVHSIWLAEDSGRISDLADDNDIWVMFCDGESVYAKRGRESNVNHFVEYFADHPTKHDAARMARGRCLLAIG